MNEMTLVLSDGFQVVRKICKLKPNTMKRMKSTNNRNYDRLLTAEQFRNARGLFELLNYDVNTINRHHSFIISQ